jgi:predicted metal-dependent hydrolase
MQDYTLLRSQRKTLAIEVTRDGRVLVRAPRRARQEEIDACLARHEGWIVKQLAAAGARRARFPEPDAGAEAEFRARAGVYIPARVEYYSNLMNVTPGHITITGAKTRFGSCSGTNRLSFSWRLLAYPPEAIEYVVVHELAHILHKNHSAAFYACIAAYLPDWRERRALLR